MAVTRLGFGGPGQAYQPFLAKAAPAAIHLLELASEALRVAGVTTEALRVAQVTSETLEPN